MRVFYCLLLSRGKTLFRGKRRERALASALRFDSIRFFPECGLLFERFSFPRSTLKDGGEDEEDEREDKR